MPLLRGLGFMLNVETLNIKIVRIMLKDTEDRDVSELDKYHLCARLKRLNLELDIVEENIMNMMRKQGPTAEFVHGLIGERENIKYKLKETHHKLYGNF
jgi:hypothetical protein